MTRTPNFTEAELGWIFQSLRAINTVYVKPPTLQPVNSNDFFNLKVREILCKPHF